MKNLQLPQHDTQLMIFSAARRAAERSSKKLLTGPACQYHVRSAPSNQSQKFKQSRLESVIDRISKLGEKADNFANDIREHVRLGPKITETVKGKLRLGARIIQVGGLEKVFKKNFSVREGEKLLKASQCYLSTTAGPIAGTLFISTEQIGFRSEKSIQVSSPNGELVRIHYKVLIPLSKIKRVIESENVKKPSRKYMEIVTVDNFEFWFMGFLNYQKTFKYLQQAILQAN
ncbi:GEM-like protein 4 [Cornus florida]|uniref:GEM-like protein 4 n=1 Tax=Cornus florida TaxID=4283 RepID=UPI0028A1F8F1|nr:GEM-like protein 4 [Cornus florida]